MPSGSPAEPAARQDGLSVYVHIPFCRAKCRYCAFASRPLADMAEMEAYAADVAAEAAAWGRRLGRPRLSSLFFGGGTPTLLPGWAWERIFSALRTAFVFPESLEISAEANPESAAASALRELAGLGVNRLSLGVQSLNDRELAFLGRPHNAAQAQRALEDALRTFRNVSVDLIWGLPGQTRSAWLATVRRMAAMQPQHVSCYGLTLEPGTPLALDHDAGRVALPAERELSGMYLAGAEALEAAGLIQYEISNFARMGHGCAHNQACWQGRDYLGLGPAAVSTLAGRRWTNPEDPAAYGRMVRDAEKNPGRLPQDAETLDQATRLREMVMLALRTTAGLDVQGLRRAGGRDLLSGGAPLATLLCNKGLARLARGRLALTRRGMLVSNAVIARLMDAAVPDNIPSSGGPS